MRQFSLNPAPPLVIEDDLLPRLTPGRQFAVVDGQVVLYDPTAQLSHVLNPSAAAVWATVDGQCTVGEIIDVIQADTGIERAVLDADVRRTLAQFVDARIITDDPDPGPEPDLAGTAAPGPETRADRWIPTVDRLLDAVAWTTVIGPVRAGTLDLVVRTDHPAAGPGAARRPGRALPAPRGGLTRSGGGVTARPAHPGRPPRLYVDGRCRWMSADPTGVVDTVVAEITQLVLSGTTDQILLHAGAVERDGRVVAVAGPSGRGKSTLTAALVQRGFAYVTDELAVVDPTSLAVSPYPKALDLDAESLNLLGLDGSGGADTPGGRRDHKGRRAVPVSALGTTSNGGRMSLLVLLDEPIAGDDDGQASDRVRAVLDLVSVTFGQSFADELRLDTLAHLSDAVPLVRLDRDGLDEMCDRVETELAARLGS